MKERRTHRLVEALKGRDKVLESPLPTNPIETAISEAVAVFVTQRGTSTKPLEYRDYHGRWRKTTDGGAKDNIGERLSTLASNNSRMDACRGIKAIKVVVFSGISRLPYEWLMDVETADVTRLGDGTAVFTRAEGWGVTQKKGEHHRSSDLLIRQRR